MRDTELFHSIILVLCFDHLCRDNSVTLETNLYCIAREKYKFTYCSNKLCSLFKLQIMQENSLSYKIIPSKLTGFDT